MKSADTETVEAGKGHWTLAVLSRICEASPEGIVICDADGEHQPVAYVNAAFERLSGYTSTELVGTDLRRLQGSDRDQEGRKRLRSAIEKGEGARALLRNYRKDGKAFWNEVLIEPVRDAEGAIRHYVSFHQDVGERLKVAVESIPKTPPVSAGLPAWTREDRLSGLCSRAYFEEILQHDWLLEQREARPLTLLLFDINGLGIYNHTFGRAAGDACIRRVAGVIAASFRRGSDIVARWKGGCYGVLARHVDVEAGMEYARTVSQRVLEQHIHHPRFSGEGIVSVRGGVASLRPQPKQSYEVLVRAAARALERSRASPSRPVMAALAEDFE